MEQIKAYYKDKKGAGCVRPILTDVEATKILTGGYNALEVRLRLPDGTVVGERIYEGRWKKWHW